MSLLSLPIKKKRQRQHTECALDENSARLFIKKSPRQYQCNIHPSYYRKVPIFLPSFFPSFLPFYFPCSFFKKSQSRHFAANFHRFLSAYEVADLARMLSPPVSSRDDTFSVGFTQCTRLSCQQTNRPWREWSQCWHMAAHGHSGQAVP